MTSLHEFQNALEVFLQNYLRGPFAGKVSNTALAEMFLEEHPKCTNTAHTVRVIVGKTLRQLEEPGVQLEPTNAFQEIQFDFPRIPEALPAAPVHKEAVINFGPNSKELLKQIEANLKEVERLKSEYNHTISPTPEYEPLHKSVNKPVSEQQEGTHLVIGCVHIPFHHKGTWNAFLEIANSLGDELKSINLIGDITDMHSISRHSKGKITIPGLTLWQEYEETNKELNKLEEAIHPNTNKHYLYGNHEDWYNQHMAEVDNAKLGNDVIASPLEAMSYRERGFTVQTNWKDAHITLGDIELIHGTYCNIHSAKKHLDVMKRNVMYVHTHSVGIYTEKDLCSYNIGWAGDRDSKAFGYMTRIQKEKWRNGFASVYVDSNGKSHPNQLLWTNGGIHFRGKLYR
jgi:hypothetical protein